MKKDGAWSLESLKKEMSSGNLITKVNWQNNTCRYLVKTLQHGEKEAQALQGLIKTIEHT